MKKRLLSLKLTLSGIFAGAIAVLSPTLSLARDSQMHFRVGTLNGSYDGTFEGDFEVSNTFDLEYEAFVSNTGSVAFRFIQALATPSSKPFYTYAGSGFRYYFFSKGVFTEQSGNGFSYSASPKFRFYGGVDVGISQVIVKTFGANVQSVANMSDAGVNLGAIYQVLGRLGVEAHVGATWGYGISSTPTNGNTQRFFLGASYYF